MRFIEMNSFSVRLTIISLEMRFRRLAAFVSCYRPVEVLKMQNRKLMGVFSINQTTIKCTCFESYTKKALTSSTSFMLFTQRTQFTEKKAIREIKSMCIQKLSSSSRRMLCKTIGIKSGSIFFAF